MENNPEEIELDQDSTNMVYPRMDDFINVPVRRSLSDICFWCPLYRIQFWLDYYTSDTFLTRLSEKFAISSSIRASNNKKKQEIKKTVRSYRYNFRKFNDDTCPSCFEKTEDGSDFTRGTVNCKTNRNIRKWGI